MTMHCEPVEGVADPPSDHGQQYARSPDDDENDPKVDDEEKRAVDQEEKLQLVLQYLEPLCNEGSEHPVMRKMGRALRSRGDDNDHPADRLGGTILSGGYTNYSYKIHLEGDPDTAVFAKVAFPHALWSSDQSLHFDLDRQTAEFHLMRRFATELAVPEEAGGSINNDGEDDDAATTVTNTSPVPMPYELIDVPSHNVRIIVAEWVAPTDEQWGNQFIEGDVDRRVVTRCAEALARINLADCDHGVNEGFVRSMGAISGGFDQVYLDILDRDRVDRTVEYVRTLGRERMEAIMAARRRADESRECLVHGDAHVFNMLVERRPNVTVGGDYTERSFGERGNFFLCDWEMVHEGHKGRDVGTFFSLPFMAAAFLATRGHVDRAKDVLETLPQFWRTYSAILSTEGGKDQQYLTEVFRSGIAFYGFFSSLAFYAFGCFREFMDTDGLSQEQQETVIATVGLVGIKSMEMGFMDDVGGHMSLDELEEFLFGMMDKEIQYLSDTVGRSLRRQSRRRSSLLRASGRRVSDNMSGFGKVVRRLSAIDHAEITSDESGYLA
jgi:Phosphotransferase enzyme family